VNVFAQLLSSRKARIGLGLLAFIILAVSYNAYRSHIASKKKMDRFAEFNRQYLANLNRQVEARDRTLNYRPFAEDRTPCPVRTRLKRQPLPYDGIAAYAIAYEDIRIDCRNPNDFVILMIGDSMTGGSAIEREKTFPDLLNRGNRVVVNAGFAGAGTDHWSPESALFDKTVIQNAGKADAVFIMLGGNDILYSRYVLQKPVDTDALKGALIEILTAVRQHHPAAALYMTNYPDKMFLGEKNYAAVESVLNSGVVGVRPGPDLSSLAMDRSNFLPDQIHLNEQGYRRAATLYEAFLTGH